MSEEGLLKGNRKELREPGALPPVTILEVTGFDDDGELYFEGYLLGGDGFEPLDDFGRPDSGCTAIKMRNDKGEMEAI